MKRDKTQIMAAILNTCISGANKTRVVYQANLNFKTVNPYLDTLVEKGFLDVKQGTRILYETTDKGTELLETLVNIEETLEG
jgi:Predicted transcriptional regulator